MAMAAMVAMATTAATADTPQAMAMARHMARHMVKDMAMEVGRWGDGWQVTGGKATIFTRKPWETTTVDHCHSYGKWPSGPVAQWPIKGSMIYLQW